jgi:hypothetical protein
MDKRTVILLCLPFVIAATVLFFLRSVKFAPSLSGTEKDMAAFSEGTVPVISKRQSVNAAILQSPIKIPSVQLSIKKEFPGQPLSQVAPPPPSPPPAAVLTLILVNSSKKMAIINGIAVKEGEVINAGKVVKIEKNRVLLQNNKELRWLKVE